MIRSLQDAPELDELIDAERTDWSDASTEDDAVYFDLFGMSIIWWPAFYSIWLSLGAALGIALYVQVKSTRSSGRTVASIGIGLAIQLLVICCVIGFGWLLNYCVRLDSRLSNPWPSQPLLMSIGFYTACAAVMAGIVQASIRKTTAHGLWVGFCIVWAVLACLTSVSLPGASYLFIAPLLVVAVVAFASLLFRLNVSTVIVASTVAVGLIWLPLDRLFYDAVGFKMAPLLFGRIAMTGTSLIPVIRLLKSGQQFWLALILVGVSVGAFAMALLKG